MQISWGKQRVTPDFDSLARQRPFEFASHVRKSIGVFGLCAICRHADDMAIPQSLYKGV